MLTITKPQNGAVLPLLTPEQTDFLRADRADWQGETIDWLNLERKNNADQSIPQPISVTWEPAIDAILQLSEWEDFRDFREIFGKGSCEIYNLKGNTTYFCRIFDSSCSSEVVKFSTADQTPRFLFVDGTTNVRDCGGWKTTDGHRVKQGMLYRGSELNSHVEITAEGLLTMKNDLKIRTDLDLRGKNEVVLDVLQENYVNIPCLAYDEYLNDPETHRKIFEFLLKKENYPVYFHCWGGADRTGTMTYLINALLGVEKSDLVDDYEITTLSIWGVRSRNTGLFQAFRARLDEFPGETDREKAEAFTLSCGITMEQIEDFRALLLE